MLFPKSSSLSLPLLFCTQSPLPRWQSRFHSVAFPAVLGLRGRSQRMQQGKRNESKCCCFLSRVRWDRWALSRKMSQRSRLQGKHGKREKTPSLFFPSWWWRQFQASRNMPRMELRRHHAYHGIVHIQTWSLRTKSQRSMVFTIWEFSKFISLQVVVRGRSQHG